MGPESLRKPAGQATLAQGSTSGTSTPAVKRKRERQIAELNGSVTPSATAQSRISAAQEREEDRLPRNLDLDNSGDDSGTDGEEGAEDQSVTLKESEDDEDVHHFPEIDIGGSESEAEEQIGGNHPDEDDDGFDSEDIDNLEDSDLGEDDVSDAGSGSSIGDADAALSRMVARATTKPDERDLVTNVLGIDVNHVEGPAPGKNPDGSNKGVWRKSAVTGVPKRVYPAIDAEYDSDSSTEEAPNRIGNVPIEWYDDLPHIGYDINGRKILRPAKGDELDRFLETVEDPDSWTSAQDRLMARNTKLSDEELDIIRRLQNAEIPDGSYDPYEPTIEWFTGKGKEMATPLTARPEPKRRFVPSKWEHKKVMKIVRAIRQGRITPRAPASQRPQYYNIWTDADAPRSDHPMHMPAPKLALPSHAESYNPPAEYLFSDQEREAWEAAEPSDRKMNFMPAKHSALRLVPGYRDFMQERFERCLDLYLAPRMRRRRLDISDPEQLVPKLPSPRELRPFPSFTGVVYRHTDRARARCVACDPKGNWLVTGAEDGRVRLWDIAIGRCAATWDLHLGSATADRTPVFGIEWCPNKAYALFAATTAGKVTVIAPPQCSATSSPSPSFTYASAAFQNPAAEDPSKAKVPVKWVRPSEAERRTGTCVHVHITGTPKQVCWHSKGDYLATVASDAGANAVLIHQLTKHRSQAPFKRANKGSAVQKVVFHPIKPQLFVATQRYVRLYDLAAQTLVKTLMPGLKWISSIDVHPGGDNVIVGSYDKRLVWFDLDLSNRPYKTLRYHTRALRAVCYHRTYPLFASTSDDGTAQIFHGTVYSDLSQNPLIVPLKILRGHTVEQGLGILDARWHPTQPWLITAGADGEARLWTT